MIDLNYVKYYVNNINIGASAYEIEKLTTYETDGMEPAVILAAVQEAVAHNARNMAYIQRVLNDWFGAGVRTAEQLKAYQESRKKGGQTRAKADGNTGTVASELSDAGISFDHLMYKPGT